MSPLARRRSLILVLVALLGFHVFHAVIQDGGGWWEKHDGIWGAIWAFFELSVKDPVLSAGLSDFVVVGGLLGALLVSQLPAERRWSARTCIWLVPMIVFPGLGALLYFLWLHPEHPFVSGGQQAGADGGAATGAQRVDTARTA